jgi:hypothetical protein
MHLINPNEIGSKISTLIAESQQKFIAISPYIDISDWKKILINLNHAKKRGVKVEFYFRELREKDYKNLNRLGVSLFRIKGLHTKMFMNDSTAIVTSMNLYEYSDLHSIDIAMQFSIQKEYNELYYYFNKYIKSKKTNEIFISKISEQKLKDLHEFISDRFSDCKINSTKSYLFSKNLVPILDVFIHTNSIGLKYPLKNPKDERIKEISSLLNNHLKQNFQLTKYNTTEETQYCKWVLDTEDYSDIDIANLISDLQRLEVDSP